MSVKNLLTFNAIFAALGVAVTLIVPGAVLNLFGLEDTAGVVFFIRFAGASSIGYAIASWLMRSAGPSAARTAFLKAGAGYVAIAVIIVYAALSGLGNAGLWGVAVFITLLGLVFMNYGFRDPDAD